MLLVVFSRMYLGVYDFSNVAAGVASGGIWLSTPITDSEILRRRNKMGTVERWMCVCSRRPLPKAGALARVLHYLRGDGSQGSLSLAERRVSPLPLDVSSVRWLAGLLIALGLRSLLNIPDPDAQAPD